MTTPLPIRSFPARLYRIKDGDTFVLTVDRGDDDTSRWTVRLRGVDAPEKKDKTGWQAATDAATRLLTVPLPDPDAFPLILITQQTKEGSLDREKYGRYLANVQLPDGTILAEQLLALGVVKAWDGQGPHPWLLMPTVRNQILDTRVHLDAPQFGGYIPKLFR